MIRQAGMCDKLSHVARKGFFVMCDDRLAHCDAVQCETFTPPGQLPLPDKTNYSTAVHFCTLARRFISCYRNFRNSQTSNLAL